MTQLRAAVPTGAGFSRAPSTVRPRYASAGDVHAAAAAIPQTIAKWSGEVGPRWRVTVSPGGIRVGTKDYARLAASEEARIQAALSDDVGDSYTHRAELGPMTEMLTRALDRGRGRKLWQNDAWRPRMVSALCSIDYSLITGDGTTPAMVTLTAPHDWETVFPTPAKFRAAVNRLRSRHTDAWGSPWAGVWKLETQNRLQCKNNGCHDARAPHLHILSTVPSGTAPRPLGKAEAAHVRACRRDDCAHDAHFREEMPYQLWLSHAWALSVAHPDPDEFAKHLKAGTNVTQGDDEQMLRYADAKRIAVYFTKHGSFANKAYQDEMPPTWRAAADSGEGGGTNRWGRWVLPVVMGVQEIDSSLIMHIMSSALNFGYFTYSF